MRVLETSDLDGMVHKNVTELPLQCLQFVTGQWSILFVGRVFQQIAFQLALGLNKCHKAS